MTKTRILAVALGMLTLIANALAKEPSPSKILDKVKSTYDSMQTCKVEGTGVSDIEIHGTAIRGETSFSILLKKPNLYLVSWTQKNMPMPGMAQSGAVWSDGTQPFLYMGIMHAYSKIGSDQMALASATGVSGGIAYTMPSLFLAGFKGQRVRSSV